MNKTRKPLPAWPKVLTPEQVRQMLVEKGLTIRAVAIQLGVSERHIHDLLAGRRKGSYGKGHDIAVALRLKAPPEGTQPVRLQRQPANHP